MREPVLRLCARAVRFAVIWLPPRRKGMSFVASVERYVPPPPGLVVGRHVSGSYVGLDLSDVVQKSMYYRGTWEPLESSMVAASLPVGGVLIDVGANAGHYSLLGAGVVGPTGVVHAIEASREMAERLSRTSRRNDLTEVITVHAVAAGDAPGEYRLQEVAGSTHSGSRYLDPSRSEGEVVEVVRLDDLLHDLDRCDVMKFDIEGSDLRALRGAEMLIRRCRPQLILAEAADDLLCRFHDDSDSMILFMAELGYDFKWLDDAVESPTLVFRPS